MGKRYAARWGKKLTLITTFTISLLVVIALSVSSPLVTLGLVGTLLGCAAFGVYGYSIVDQALLIHRMGWSTRIDLTELKSAEHNPSALKGSIRTLGNGGLFAFVGRFWSKALGKHRVYATRGEDSVVLRFPNGTLVVTPEDSGDFVAQLSTILDPHDR